MRMEVPVPRKVMKHLADLSFSIRPVNENYANFYIRILRLLTVHSKKLADTIVVVYLKGCFIPKGGACI